MYLQISTYLSVYLLIHPSIHLPVCPPISLPLPQPLYLSCQNCCACHEICTCQHARPCPWDLRHFRASVATRLHLSRNVSLSLRKCCACHGIYTSGCETATPVKHNLIANPTTAPTAQSTPQVAEAMRLSRETDASVPTDPVAREALRSRQLSARRRRQNSRQVIFSVYIPPPHARACFLACVHSFFACAQDHFSVGPATRKFLLNFL